MDWLLRHFKGSDLKVELLKGATGTAFLKVSNTVLTMGVGVLLARLLGPEDYGIYAYVLSIITLLGLPTKAGLPTLVIRETAMYQLQEKWALLRGLLVLSNGFVIGFSILVALISGIIISQGWFTFDNVSSNIFLWSLWLLPLIAFGNLRGATLKGLRKVVIGQLPEELIRPLFLIILLFSSLVLGISIDSKIAMQFTVVAALIAFIVGAVLLSRHIPKEVRSTVPNFQLSIWISSLIPLSLITGIQIINAQVGTVVLGSLGLNEDIGLLKVATSAAMLASTTLMMFNTVLAPHIVRLWKQEQYDKLTRMLKLTARGSFVVTLFVCIILYIWGREIIELLFGVEFSGSYAALVILLIGQIVSTAVGSVGLILKQLNLEKKVLIASILSLVLNFVFCVVLAPLYGMIGIAVSYAVSIAIWNLLNWYFALKHANLDCSIVGLKRR